jgi:DNA-binding PadR family transcriptional regulator
VYILSSLAERGPLHGHALRSLAEQEQLHEWTEISTGALYGALKRMLTDELIAVDRVEREGNYPERQVYRITELGERALVDLRAEIFARTELPADPFDLVISRLDPDRLEELADGIRARRDAYAAELADDRTEMERVGPHLWLAEKLSWQHKIVRIEAEIAWHDRVLAAVPDIIADETTRRGQEGHK